MPRQASVRALAGGRRLCGFAALCASLAVAAALPAMAAAAEVKPFESAVAGGLTCTTGTDQGDVRFCEGNGTTERVPTWDGVPLDADVTLPPASAGPGPYPTIVMLHGWAESKTSFESTTPAGNGTTTYDYNNDYYAEHGYAVLNYTDRGFGKSCGKESTEPSIVCTEKGFIRLDDERYEARDTQYLLGLLVAEGIAKPGALGVTGISYGGGQSIELAYLKNRIRCAGATEETYTAIGPNPCAGEAESEFADWTSPTGQHLEIDAAYARWPWSDLASALLPNGRFLDYDNATDGEDGASGTDSPIGVPITSYITGLFGDGAKSGTYEPVTGSPEWNLTKDYALVAQAEPENEEDQKVVNSIADYHGGYTIPGSEAPAPLLMESGWNDDLFPPRESLRVYNSVREKYGPSAEVALQFGDVGHSRGTNKPRVNEYFNAQGAAFFDAKLKGESAASVATTTAPIEAVTAPKAGGVTAFTTTCPSEPSVPDGGPFSAASWEALKPGMVTLASSTAQTVTSPASAEDESLNSGFDPIVQDESPDACKAVAKETPSGNAAYSEAVRESFTMMGLPTIAAKVKVTGTEKDDGELDGRLWDVMANGEQRLISRGDYRLEESQAPNIVFQLHGNGYEFVKGDEIKLELTTSEYPYFYRVAGADYSVDVESVQLSLPTLNPPNGKQIEAPATMPMPEAPLATKATEAATVKQCRSTRTVKIKLPKYKHRKITKVVLTLKGKKVKTVKARKRRRLKSVSYTFAKKLSGNTTLKLKLTLKKRKHEKMKHKKTEHRAKRKQTEDATANGATAKHRRAKSKKKRTKTLSRKYDLCG